MQYFVLITGEWCDTWVFCWCSVWRRF